MKHDGVEYCIAPDISPPRHDLTDERLREITEYFTAEEGMYRSPTDKSNPDVEIVARFKKISQVDTPEERFGATLRLTFTWLVTKEVSNSQHVHNKRSCSPVGLGVHWCGYPERRPPFFLSFFLS